jgi:hypothetical protein
MRPQTFTALFIYCVRRWYWRLAAGVLGAGLAHWARYTFAAKRTYRRRLRELKAR